MTGKMDLRKNMRSNFDSRGVLFKLNVGAEVQFDLSIRTIQSPVVLPTAVEGDRRKHRLHSMKERT
jgi:hypothetical protein